MSKYAEGTKVPVARSRAEIQRLIERYGATEFAFGVTQERTMFQFTMKGYRARFEVPLPKKDRYESDAKFEQRTRQRWRAMVLVLKAKLESVENNIERFDEAFMPYLVLPDSSTVGDRVLPDIQQALEGGELPPLLPAPRGAMT